MPMDLLKAAGTPIEVELGGVKLLLSPVRLRHLAENSAWCVGKLGNPIEKVMEALQSQAGRERDLWAARTLARYERAIEPLQKLRAEIDAEVEAARRANRLPDPAIVSRAVEGPGEDLEAEAALAREWKSERRELLLTSYRDSYGPKPAFDDPIFSPLMTSLEGMVYEVWLSIRQRQPELFPSHLDLLDFVQDHLAEFMDVRRKLSLLNDPDPEKNGPGRPAEPAADANPPTGKG